jgi:RecB family exonuclease
LAVHVVTFDDLYADCLQAAGDVFTLLPEPVVHRLLKRAIASSSPTYYSGIAEMPGFVRLVDNLILALKAANVPWQDFSAALESIDGEDRLSELATIYREYQQLLGDNRWADWRGMGLLALDAVRRENDVASGWGLVAFDGFDSFTQAQLELMQELSQRVDTTLITLTGCVDGQFDLSALRRFESTREQLEAAFAVASAPVPGGPAQLGPFQLLATSLYRRSGNGGSGGGTNTVEMIEAADRPAEVREALRWLKRRIVEDGLAAGTVALLARDMRAYRAYALEVAAEYGIPVELAAGLPLNDNPAIASLLDLLRIMLPLRDDDGADSPGLSRRLVVEAWRSPYFDWSHALPPGSDLPVGIGAHDADELDRIARLSCVMAGRDQWLQAFEQQGAQAERADDPDCLAAKFERFVALIRPPVKARIREYVSWLEDLIGDDQVGDDTTGRVQIEETGGGRGSLGVVMRAQLEVAGAPHVAEADIAALSALKDVLRGLVWAEEVDPTAGDVTFAGFFRELQGAVDAATYRSLALEPGRGVLVADVSQARAVPLKAIALLGLAEGEFPRTITEDVLLRDSDRARLRDECGLALDPSLESPDMELFYETVAQAELRLLVTRPRLADAGSSWQPSPFWHEIARQAGLKSAGSGPALEETCGSWTELLESAASERDGADSQLIADGCPDRWRRMQTSAMILAERYSQVGDSEHDGWLVNMADRFGRKYRSERPWSSSRIESYRSCPFQFFVGSVLGLEPRPEPQAGLDGRQLGNIYHHILENVYQAADDPSDAESVVAALEDCANPILDEAPDREGFRETAWWQETRREILEHLERSIVALGEEPGDFTPAYYEARFMSGDQLLEVVDGDDSFRLRGLIDRVDTDPSGGVRIIDYKTAGPYQFTRPALLAGKKIQIALYALAARDALQLGTPVDGFYWHVQHAQRSSLTLAGFEGGPEAAMAVAAARAWEAVRGARSGRFAPHPPPGGCPEYCSAAGFCWHYSPPRRG